MSWFARVKIEQINKIQGKKYCKKKMPHHTFQNQQVRSFFQHLDFERTMYLQLYVFISI